MSQQYIQTGFLQHKQQIRWWYLLISTIKSSVPIKSMKLTTWSNALTLCVRGRTPSLLLVISGADSSWKHIALGHFHNNEANTKVL